MVRSKGNLGGDRPLCHLRLPLYQAQEFGVIQKNKTHVYPAGWESGKSLTFRSTDRSLPGTDGDRQQDKDAPFGRLLNEAFGVAREATEGNEAETPPPPNPLKLPSRINLHKVGLRRSERIRVSIQKEGPDKHLVWL